MLHQVGTLLHASGGCRDSQHPPHARELESTAPTFPRRGSVDLDQYEMGNP